jgi:hypothetical protein
MELFDLLRISQKKSKFLSQDLSLFLNMQVDIRELAQKLHEPCGFWALREAACGIKFEVTEKSSQWKGS